MYDTSAGRPHPSVSLDTVPPRDVERPGFLVDLRRCIGCHACSVACKTAHAIPLGEFPLRVRWLPRPDEKTFAFVPVFSESRCTNDAESLSAGLEPACVRACPTAALVFGDLADPEDAIHGAIAELEATRLEAPDADDLKRDVHYVELEDFVSGKIHRGAQLDPRDEDPIYEQEGR